jgi:hypothetical protein
VGIDSVRPGDWAVISTGTNVTIPIVVAEYLADGFKNTMWNHAVIASRWDKQRGLMIVEAMSNGAVEVPWHYDNRPHAWSTDSDVPWSLSAGKASMVYAARRTPYGLRDYAYIAMYRTHVPWPNLKANMASTDRLICSQLVDQSCQDAGVHLYTDGRPPGDVMPSDIGHLIGV